MRLAFATAALVMLAGTTAARAEPSLAFNPGNIARAKQLIAADTEARKRWEASLAVANRAIAQPPRNDKGSNIALEALALAFRITGDAKYAAAARALLLQRAEKKDWLTDLPLARRTPPWKSDLGMGTSAASIGIAYDAVRDILSPADRRTISQGLINEAILPIVNDWIDGAQRIHTLDTMGHNWWAHIVFSAGIAALAVRHDDPRGMEWARRIDEAGPEWFEFPGTQIGVKPPTFDKDGGYSETVGYAELALHSLMLFRRSWTESMDTPPSAIKGLDKVADYFLAAAYPRKDGWVSLNFGDSRPFNCGCHTLADFWALGKRNPDYLRYIAGFDGVPDKDAWAEPSNLPYFPDAAARAVAERAIAEPKNRVFKGQGLLTMRDSWNPDSTLFAVKSGFSWNHNHADAGSFILYHKGRTLLADSGHSNYSTPEYDGYFRQSEAHNVVTTDGHAEPRSDLYDGSRFMGTIDHLLDTPDLRYAWADASGPTSRYFQRNYRSTVWIGDTILIVDDMRSWDTGQFEWLLHYNGEAKRQGKTIEIRDQDAAVNVSPLFPATLPDGGLPTDYPEALRVVKHDGISEENVEVRKSYLGFQPSGKSDREKFIVAIQPQGDGKASSRLERLEGLNWIGTRVTSDSRVTEVYVNLMADGRVRHRNANATIAGYDTDAYIFAVSWPRGKDRRAKPDQITIVDGSYVRRDGKALLDALSKLTLHIDYGASRRITFDQPPPVNVRLGCDADFLTGQDHVLCRQGVARVARHVAEGN